MVLDILFTILVRPFPLFPAVAFLPTGVLSDSPNVDVFQKMFPEIPISTHSTSLFILNTDRFYTSLSMFSAGVLIMSETAIFCGLIIWNMWKQHEHTSKRAFELQKRFLVALAIQISVPFIILAGPATYNCFSILTRYYNPVANNVVLITVSTHGWVSAIVMLTIHEPYRNFCFGWIKRTKVIGRQATISAIF